jgi:hypothetical protein
MRRLRAGASSATTASFLDAAAAVASHGKRNGGVPSFLMFRCGGNSACSGRAAFLTYHRSFSATAATLAGDALDMKDTFARRHSE